MSEAGFGIYIHWPFCTAICPYCDFNVHRARGADSRALIGAIADDLKGHAARHSRRWAESLFLGGGTPSLLTGAEIARLIDAADAAFGLKTGAEITLESNPEDAARFADHASAGVTRFSIGAQAFEDAALKRLGRFHDAAASVRAVEAAARTGARVSLDLIYAREGQSVADWMRELRFALTLPIEHLSLYQLTIEAGTAFDRAVTRGTLKPPGAEEGAALYEETQALCAMAGYPAYEVSNHARDAKAWSRHNLIYWRGGDWVGVGPGAHGRLTVPAGRIATEAHKKPAAYIAAVKREGVGWASQECLNARDVRSERLIMGLRIEEGVPRDLVADAAALAALAADGLLKYDASRVRLTRKGRQVLDYVLRRLA